MYSNKENINILTALLVAHGIRHAVVCPGSRNAPIVHNLNVCPDITVYPVTDERSAGFYALGMAQALGTPVVVCVTSGTALLNLSPAVAEAKHQHQSIIVISADRPPQWIGQLDGQTMPQPDALGHFVSMAVTLPECNGDSNQQWYCNRLVNEALLATTGKQRTPVHINVPISEPLFDYSVSELPQERVIRRVEVPVNYDALPTDFVETFAHACRPMIVIGQMSPYDYADGECDSLFKHVVVLHEALAPLQGACHFDEVLCALQKADTAGSKTLQLPPPDVVLHVGDAIISKRLKHYLRQAKDVHVWRLTPSTEIEDTFQHLEGVVVGQPLAVLSALSRCVDHRISDAAKSYRQQWQQMLDHCASHAADYHPRYSQMAAVREFESQLPGASCSVHYANSSVLRLANIYAAHHVWCNRGVNGIEGSLSTAAGFSVVSPLSPISKHPIPELSSSALRPSPLTFIVIGDLSFFYDQNALWNTNLSDNLRVLLLNNGKGGIFNMLPGLKHDEEQDRLVAASHSATAEGICQQNNMVYRQACDMGTMQAGITWLVTAESDRPMLLEVLTNADKDAKALNDYYKFP